MTPFEWVVGDSSKDHTVTALTSVTTSPVTERYTTMRDSTDHKRACLCPVSEQHPAPRVPAKSVGMGFDLRV